MNGECVFSEFGYELWVSSMIPNFCEVLNEDGNVVARFNNTIDAKNWMKENKR